MIAAPGGVTAAMVRTAGLAVGCLAALILGTTAASADTTPRPEACLAADPYRAPPDPAGLPDLSAVTDADIARFVLPYARMAQDVASRTADNLAPFGFYRGLDSHELFLRRGEGERLQAAITGFYATTFLHCDTNAVVIAYRSMDPFDPRDYVVSLVRQVGEGRSSLAVAFFDAVREAYPDRLVAVVVGHSSGGGLASYVGAVRDVPSIAFGPVRTEAALLNTGSRQMVVVVTGDIFVDPLAPPAAGPMGLLQRYVHHPEQIRGTLFRIAPTGRYRTLAELHGIHFLIAELDRLIGGGLQ